MTFNQVVRGSNPRTLIKKEYADVAELADALDLGSSSSECRFDSCYPHSKSRRAAILVGFRLLFLGSGNKMVIFYL